MSKTKKFGKAKYYRDRYNNEPEFREKMKGWVKKYQQENKELVNKKQRLRYKNRTPKQIKTRQVYLKKFRMV